MVRYQRGSAAGAHRAELRSRRRSGALRGAANIRDKITGCVHIVGHSLGGALATLSADWIKAEYSLPVKLYTFGSPRVGLDNFSRAATSRIDKIYRCTHGADPVTKVPLWPFSHAPYNGQEIRLDNGQGLKGAAHKLFRWRRAWHTRLRLR